MDKRTFRVKLKATTTLPSENDDSIKALPRPQSRRAKNLKLQLRLRLRLRLKLEAYAVLFGN